jgi:hypothetical protein
MSAQTAPYPVHLDARLEPRLSRWLWLVKWFLLIPHAIVLFFLWTAFCLTTIVAFFSILFAQRYPRALFDFNVGVLRWTWRVMYYAYGALGTDQYPPFTLTEVSDYPAHLEIDYPERLSRGLVLVKWWLLAIPHYLIIGIFMGGSYVAWQSGDTRVGSAGLISILVLVAAVILAFTGRYPQSLFDLVLGLNRWVLRVAAYAGLMTDQYPPFRLDVGGSEEGGRPSTLTVSPDTASRTAARPSGWNAGRIIAMVAGAILVLSSFGALAAGITGIVFDRTQRDADGYLHTGPETFDTSGYALTSEGMDMRFDEPGLRFARAFLGKARVRVTPADDAKIFAGVAPTADADRYLGGVERARVSGMVRDRDYRTVPGGAPGSAPTKQTFWTSEVTGAGTQTLRVPIRSGDWTLVVMNANGSRGVGVRADFGVTAPNLAWIALAALIVGAVLLAAGAGLMVGASVRASGRRA